MASRGIPRGIKAEDWDSFLSDLEEYRDRDRDQDVIGFEANEAAQSITERCIELFLPNTGSQSSGEPS